MEAATRVAGNNKEKLLHFLYQARDQAETGLVEIKSASPPPGSTPFAWT